MAADDPTPDQQAAARAQVIANGWATPGQVDTFIANEGGPRTSTQRILSAFAPNPGPSATAAAAAVTVTPFATPTPFAGTIGDLLNADPHDGILRVSNLAAVATPAAAPLRLVVSNGSTDVASSALASTPSGVWVLVAVAVAYLLWKG